MKNKFKAFTLVELIVVIAIFGILMMALMNFFRPVRQTYIDSTLYDQQRTTQNGILEYLCESTRYANKMVIYDEGSPKVAPGASGTVSSAIDALADFCNANSITEAADIANVRVIVINRKQGYDKLGTQTSTNPFYGRLITNIKGKTFVGDDKGIRTASATGDTYMALGGAYYGAADFIISIDKAGTFESGAYKGGITFSVTNTYENSGNIVRDGTTINGASSLTTSADGISLTTVQGNITKNLSALTYSYKAGTGDTPNGSKTSTGSWSGLNANTYIVFTVPEENDR